MKIGLSFMTQIRGGENTGGLVPSDTDLNSPRSLGGWIALTFNQLVAGLTSGYHTEHNDNDTHAAIHCTSISERSRLTPLGEWIAPPFIPSDFSGTGSMTWTVSAANVINYKYTVVGTTMIVAFYIANTSVGGVLDSFLRIRIPGGYRQAGYYFNNCTVVDNTVTAIGYVATNPPSPGDQSYIYLAHAPITAWMAAAGTTSMWGQLSFEVLH